MLSHSDPQVQALIETLEFQRDNAVLLASQRAGQIAALTADVIAANAEATKLREALEAAGHFQDATLGADGNVHYLTAAKVETIKRTRPELWAAIEAAHQEGLDAAARVADTTGGTAS